MAGADYLDLRLAELLERLSAGSPGPAGGSAAAVTATVAAGLVAMAARRSRDSWAEAAGVAAQAQALRARCAPLAEADARVLAEALAALEGREGELELRLERAAAVPLEIAAVAADVAELAALTAERCEGTFRGDAAAAAVLAEAAVRVAAKLVAINLGVTQDDERLALAERLAATAADSARRALDAGP